MGTYKKIYQAAEELASRQAAEQISYAAIAERAGVHWTTVRRYLGSKPDMHRLLTGLQSEQGRIYSDTRTRVMEAAVKVFSKYGYAGATMDQVALEAGQTKSVVYWHFSNKTDLYLAICERNLAEQASLLPYQVEEIVRAENRIDALAGWLKEQLASCAAAPGRPLLFFEFLTSCRDPGVKDIMQGLFEAFYAKVTAVFRALQERGVIRRDVDAASMAVYVQSVLNGTVLSWLLAPEEMETGRFAHDAAVLLWESMAVR